jgi:hypothetical protein
MPRQRYLTLDKFNARHMQIGIGRPDPGEIRLAIGRSRGSR